MKHFEFSFDSEVVEVEQGHWDHAEDPQVLLTTGLGPCIGVAIYDPATKRGHMGHFVAPNDEKIIVADFLHSAVSSTPDVGNLRLWIRGSEPDPDPIMFEYGKAGRTHLLQVLEAVGIRQDQIDLVWNQPGILSTSIALDCATGEFSEQTHETSDEEWNSMDPYDY